MQALCYSLLFFLLAHVAFASPKQSDPVNGCWDCSFSPNGECCASGQMCPGNVPCCGTGSGAYSCTTSCTPQCSGKQCGNGGCKMLNDTICGTCPSGEVCNDDGQCTAPPVCLDCWGGTTCCLSGQICPGGEACCGTCPSGTCSCSHNCTPQCKGLECGGWRLPTALK